ncbi:MAG: PASTA domain-containing protein [Clostridia bacterium]|nr:PASTA domain-containing protein [Clostridia bacterium]
MAERDNLLAGRYRLLEKIASGGSAHIYRALDEKTQQIVAVKILKKELTKNYEFVQRFKKEVQASLKLRHANIIRAFDAGLDGDRYFIVMELINGRTLKQLITAEGPLPPKYVVSVAKKLCLALEYAHVKGFIHRDIKPHNVMIDESGEPYIADFGIARNMASNTITSEESAVMGSVHYFSPEQAKGERVDKRTDIYSLGVLLYEMLTGTVPFDADSSVAIALKHINEPTPELTDVPMSLNRIVQKATQKDKHFRYKTAFNMYEDLARALSDPDGEYVKYTESKRSKQHAQGAQAARPRRRLAKVARWAAVFAGLTLAVVFGIWGFIRGQVRAQMLVPQVVGETSTEASTILTDAGFHVRVIEENSDRAAGEVIRQSPEYGKSAAAGTDVVLYVSQGVGAQKMPSVTNMPVDRAKQILRSAGLTATIVEEPEGEISIGYVLEQSPPAGADIAAATDVVLTVKVSTEGYLITVPDVTGQPLPDALSMLTDSGFSEVKLYEMDDEGYGGSLSGEVYSQDPESGSELMSSKPVSLHYWAYDYPDYIYTGEVAVRADRDQTSVQVGIVGEVDSVPVCSIVADTLVEEGTHQIELSPLSVDADTPTVQAELVVYVDDVPLQSRHVELERVD